MKRSIHSMSSFSFFPTTPSPYVGKIISTYFLSCTPKNSILIISSNGVMSANLVRTFGSNDESELLKKFIIVFIIFLIFSRIRR
jgi:hypothetical protein